jgi:hypothetical protein
MVWQTKAHGLPHTMVFHPKVTPPPGRQRKKQAGKKKERHHLAE